MSRRDRSGSHRTSALLGLFVVLSAAVGTWYVIGDEGRRGALSRLDVRLWVLLFGACVLGSVMYPFAWAQIHERERRPEAFRRYVMLQPAKYFPGGLAQGALQVSESRRAEGSWGAASVRYGTHLVVVVGAGLAVGSCALVRLLMSATLWESLGVVVGGLFTLLVILRFGGERVSWIRAAVKNQAIRRSTYYLSFVTSGLGLVAWGVAYWLVASRLGGDSGVVVSVSQFAAAWVLGFLAFPIPAGAGVREAFLVLVAEMPADVAITASLIVRVGIVFAEVALSVVAYGVEVAATRTK